MKRKINKKIILQSLTEKYNKRGANFTFKCRYIARQLGTNTYTISRHISYFKEKGIIKERDRTKSGIIYETCF